MSDHIIQNYLDDAIISFRNYKQLAEKAMAQIGDEEFFAAIDEEANSVAVIVKHVAGNLVSRWTDFLASDGEKPDRNRDSEFEMIGDTRQSLMEFWQRGWQTLFDAIEQLTPADFGKTVMIRSERHTITEALNRQMTHYAYHVGQIVFLAKHFRSSQWKTLSVPRNRSAEFTKILSDRQVKGEERTSRVDAPDLFRDETK